MTAEQAEVYSHLYWMGPMTSHVLSIEIKWGKHRLKNVLKSMKYHALAEYKEGQWHAVPVSIPPQNQLNQHTTGKA